MSEIASHLMHDFFGGEFGESRIARETTQPWDLRIWVFTNTGHAPTVAAKMHDFYSQLNAVVDKIPKNVSKILMGHFNAIVGSDNSDYEHIMRRHGFGKISDNWELLAELCGNNDMVIGGSLFPHRPVHEVTASRKIKSIISTLAENGAVAFLMWTNVASDHHLLIGKIRFNTRQLEDAAVKRSYVEELENRAANIPEGRSVEN